MLRNNSEKERERKREGRERESARARERETRKEKKEIERAVSSIFFSLSSLCPSRTPVFLVITRLPLSLLSILSRGSSLFLRLARVLLLVRVLVYLCVFSYPRCLVSFVLDEIVYEFTIRATRWDKHRHKTVVASNSAGIAERSFLRNPGPTRRFRSAYCPKSEQRFLRRHPETVFHRETFVGDTRKHACRCPTINQLARESGETMGGK